MDRQDEFEAMKLYSRADMMNAYSVGYSDHETGDGWCATLDTVLKHSGPPVTDEALENAIDDVEKQALFPVPEKKNAREVLRNLFAAAREYGWNRAHEPAKCGHARANYRDAKYGTPEYEGEETCEFCAAVAAAKSQQGYSREAQDILEQARSALTSNMKCLSHSRFGDMQRATAKVTIERINAFLQREDKP